MPETSSHSAVHSIALPPSLSSTSFALTAHSSPRTTETTTSTTNNSDQRSHRSISPQKETAAASIQNGVSRTEMRVPETCTNNAEGAASNSMCCSSDSTNTNDNGSSSSSGGSSGDSDSPTKTSNINSTTAPVSIAPQPN